MKGQLKLTTYNVYKQVRIHVYKTGVINTLVGVPKFTQLFGKHSYDRLMLIIGKYLRSGLDKKSFIVSGYKVVIYGK